MRPAAPLRRALTLALALAAAVPAARAATFVETTVEEAARSAEAVVRGRVLAVSSRLTRDGRRVVTDVDVAVASAWKGTPEPVVRLVVPGGVAGGLGMKVDGAPEFTVGEEVVLFLNRQGDLWRVGNLLGKYRVEGAEARPGVDLASVVPRPLPGGERAAGPMSVAELEARVRAAR